MGMKHANAPLLVAIAGSALLTACAASTRTDYQRPSVEMPESYFSQRQTPGDDDDATLAADAPWWEAFGDERLSALIERVLEENADVRTAAVRVRRARLQAGIEEDALWVPRFSAEGNASYSTRFEPDSGEDSFGLSAGVSYDVDLWGEGQHALSAAQFEAAASEEDLAGVRLSVSVTAATLYWQLAYLEARIELSAQSIAYAQQTLDLTRTKREAGTVSDLDVLQAQRNLANQRAAHEELLRQRSVTANALTILSDTPPTPTPMAVSALPESTLPAIDAGLPANLLLRRPDLRAAELRLRAALARTDATRAGYLPSLSLSGSIGTIADDISDLLSNPVGTIAARVTLPFLNYNEMRLSVDLSRTEYEEEAIAFRQTLYGAIAEVEDALANRDSYLAQRDLLSETLDRARQTEALYETRYRAGVATIQDWLDAQENRRAAEAALLDANLNLLTNRAAAYEALGGSTAPSETS